MWKEINDENFSQIIEKDAIGKLAASRAIKIKNKGGQVIESMFSQVYVVSKIDIAKAAIFICEKTYGFKKFKKTKDMLVNRHYYFMSV